MEFQNITTCVESSGDLLSQLSLQEKTAQTLSLLLRKLEEVVDKVNFLYNWHKTEYEAMEGFAKDIDFDRAALAGILGVDKSTVTRWIAARKIHVAPGERLISYAEVMRAINEGRIAESTMKKLEYAERLNLVSKGRWMQIKGQIKSNSRRCRTATAS